MVETFTENIRFHSVFENNYYPLNSSVMMFCWKIYTRNARQYFEVGVPVYPLYYFSEWGLYDFPEYFFLYNVLMRSVIFLDLTSHIGTLYTVSIHMHISKIQFNMSTWIQAQHENADLWKIVVDKRL